MNRDAGCEAKLQAPVASEVLALTSEVASMACQVAEKLESKLGSVMRIGSPKPNSVNEKTCREYPPLFSEWSSHICSIRSSLESIEDLIRRLEL